MVFDSFLILFRIIFNEKKKKKGTEERNEDWSEMKTMMKDEKLKVQVDNSAFSSGYGKCTAWVGLPLFKLFGPGFGFQAPDARSMTDFGTVDVTYIG